jgi:thymidine kinase
MAELTFYTGPMDSGKSTLALQTNYNRQARGLFGHIFTAHDRAGTAVVSSRLGLAHDAIEVSPAFDFWGYTTGRLAQGERIDYYICDEAQFYTPGQVDALAEIVDELEIDVFCFGILTDFRTKLFPGSARLVELADNTQVLQVEALCWCGKRATHNARVEEGSMVTEGEIIVVGNIGQQPLEADRPGLVSYEVLCRQHHRLGMTAGAARDLARGAQPPAGRPPRAGRRLTGGSPGAGRGGVETAHRRQQP